MAAKVKAIPDGYEGSIPYLICKGAAAALEFYKKAFGAQEILRMPGPGGIVGHAEFRIGKAVIMMADECPDGKFKSPQSLGGTPVSLYIYVPDVDAFAKQAAAAGAKISRPPTTQFYGDRSCGIEDPFGHQWGFASHVEDVSPEELEKRAAAMGKQSPGAKDKK